MTIFYYFESFNNSKTLKKNKLIKFLSSAENIKLSQADQFATFIYK